MSDQAIAILAMLVTVFIGAPTAYLAYAGVSDRREKNHRNEVKDIVEEVIAPLKSDVADLKVKVDSEMSKNHGTSIKDAVEEVRSIARRLDERNP